MGRINKDILNNNGIKEKNAIEEARKREKLEQRSKEVKQRVDTDKTEATSFLISSTCSAVKSICTILIFLLAFVGLISICFPGTRNELVNLISYIHK